MGTRNKHKELLGRLESKTLDFKFLHEIQHGLNCSPFESEAVLSVVKEVYLPYFDDSSATGPPGKVTLVAVSADEPAGKSVVDCQKQSVCLTLHRGIEDDRILRRQGPAAFRQARIADVTQEALSQGALLTCEDLAFRVFFVTPRTITRDLNCIRRENPGVMIPLRSTVHDIGPVLTHRTEIIRLALEGRTTTQICQILRHSPAAVANYISTFTRIVQLAEKEMQVGQIAFLVRRGKGLVQKYLDLLKSCKADKNMMYHLDELLRIGVPGNGKKKAGGQ